jgi:nucleoside-diphosphate-sugar epimerase
VEAFCGQTILVVGGAGFVGSNLVRMLLLAAPQEIVIIDNLLSAEAANVPDVPAVTFIQDSITSASLLDRLTDDFDYIFHLATYHGNQSSIHNPLQDHANNTLTTLMLYEKIKGFRRPKKVVYSSAGCTVAAKTFDEVEATTEDAPVSLYHDSPYQISKIIGELYSNYYFTQYRLPVVKARFQNVYGPGEILGAGAWRGTPATIWRNVVPTFVYKALHGLPLPVENRGMATRDFIYIDDICRGLVACALRGQPGEVYNLASGRAVAILELAQLLNQMTANPAGIDYVPQRAWDHAGKRFGSTVKAKNDLDFEASVGLHEGLAATVAWTRENLALIQRCIDKHQPYLQSSR